MDWSQQYKAFVFFAITEAKFSLVMNVIINFPQYFLKQNFFFLEYCLRIYLYLLLLKQYLLFNKDMKPDTIFSDPFLYQIDKNWQTQDTGESDFTYSVFFFFFCKVRYSRHYNKCWLYNFLKIPNSTCLLLFVLILDNLNILLF